MKAGADDTMWPMENVLVPGAVMRWKLAKSYRNGYSHVNTIVDRDRHNKEILHCFAFLKKRKRKDPQNIHFLDKTGRI